MWRLWKIIIFTSNWIPPESGESFQRKWDFFPLENSQQFNYLKKFPSRRKFLRDLNAPSIFLTFQHTNSSKSDSEHFRVSTESERGKWKIKKHRAAQAGVCVNNEISFRIYGVWQHKTYFASSFCFIRRRGNSLLIPITVESSPSMRPLPSSFLSVLQDGFPSFLRDLTSRKMFISFWSIFHPTRVSIFFLLPLRLRLTTC